jgi:hypothetical protein
LTTVIYSDVTAIGNVVFESCSSLTTVNLPAATEIGNYAFDSCSSLTSVDLPAATEIGDSAFLSCSSLTSVNLPAATAIGNNAFISCSSLTTVNLPAATTIGDYAFQSSGGTPLTITLGMEPPTVGTGMFQNVVSKSVTVKVQVPDGEVAPGGYDADWQTGFKGGNNNIELTMDYGGAALVD